MARLAPSPFAKLYKFDKLVCVYLFVFLFFFVLFLSYATRNNHCNTYTCIRSINGNSFCANVVLLRELFFISCVHTVIPTKKFKEMIHCEINIIYYNVGDL